MLLFRQFHRLIDDCRIRYCVKKTDLVHRHPQDRTDHRLAFVDLDFGILIDDIVILDAVFHGSLADPLDKRTVLPRQELVFIEGVPYSKMAGRFLPVHLKQNVHNQLSCIDCISHHFS